jgi:peptide/nickel transport system permease protein
VRRLLLRRLGQLVVVLLLVSFLTLLMLRLLPVNPAYAIYGQNATKAQVAQVEHQLGLDQPLLVQYGHWLGQVLTGNLGTSLRTGQTVTSALATTLPVTLELVIVAEIIALAVAIPAGVYSAYRADGKLDRAVSAASSGMVAIPGFVLALVLVYFFAYLWRIFPATGWVALAADPVGNLRHVILPALTLAAVEAAVFTRVL